MKSHVYCCVLPSDGSGGGSYCINDCVGDDGGLVYGDGGGNMSAIPKFQLQHQTTDN